MLKAILLSVLAFLLVTASSHAAQSKTEREAEAKQAESEDEAARKANPEAINSNFSGKLVLFTKEQKEDYADSGVVGTFATEKTVYLVKLEAAGKLETLKPYDGQTCTVTGKVRNEGKYLIIQKMVPAGAEYNFLKRRGGIGM